MGVNIATNLAGFDIVNCIRKYPCERPHQTVFFAHEFENSPPGRAWPQTGQF